MRVARRIFPPAWAIPLLDGLARPMRLIADKGYCTMTPRRWLKRRRMRAMILSLATRTFRFAEGKAFKRPRLIGRMGRGLKNWHRIALRHTTASRWSPLS